MISDATKNTEKHGNGPSTLAGQDYKVGEKTNDVKPTFANARKITDSTVVGDMKPDEKLRKDSPQEKRI